MSFNIEEIKSESTKDSTVVKVSGRVDSNTSPELDMALQMYAERGHNVVLKVHEVDYMSSAGIRALVSAYRTTKKRGRELVLVHPSARVTDVLQLAGLTSIFIAYDNVAGAIIVLEN